MTFSQHPPTDLFNKQLFFFSFSFIFFFLPNGQTAVRDVHLSASCFCDPTESLRGFRIKKKINKKITTSFFFFSAWCFKHGRFSRAEALTLSKLLPQLLRRPATTATIINTAALRGSDRRQTQPNKGRKKK